MAHELHGEGFGSVGGVLLDDLVAEVDENLGNVDFDGADLVAGPAKGGGVGEGFGVVHLLELRGEDGSDGTGIDAAVGVASGLAVDGAGVLTGSATDAVEGLPGFGVGEHGAAAVIEEDDVIVARAVAGGGPRPEGVVGVHALAGGAAGDELEHDFKVLEAGEDFVDAGDRDEGVGESEAHAAVAFALDDADGAGFGDEEVGSADGGGDAEEFFAEEGAGGVCQGLGGVADVGEVHLAAEDLADLVAVLVEGRDHDVGGLVAA